MKHAKPCIAFAAMSLLTASAVVAQPANPAVGPLSVFLSNSNAASPLVLETLRIELEEIMAPTGVGLAWHDGEATVDGRLAVIRLQGVCKADAPLPFELAVTLSSHNTDPEALGKTHISNGQVLPFADIRCDHVRKFILTPLRSGANPAARDLMLGRALARVIAHELYHILLRTQTHGRSGIARATQTAAQLVAERVTFAQADERRIAEEVAAEESATSSSVSAGDNEPIRRNR
jgi:hypothetical protein